MARPAVVAEGADDRARARGRPQPGRRQLGDELVEPLVPVPLPGERVLVELGGPDRVEAAGRRDVEGAAQGVGEDDPVELAPAVVVLVRRAAESVAKGRPRQEIQGVAQTLQDDDVPAILGVGAGHPCPSATG